MNGEMTTMAAWLFLMTFFLPPVIAVIKRLALGNLPEVTRDLIVFLLCAVAGLGEAYFNGSLKWANGDLGATFAILIVNVAFVVQFAFGWYKMFWKPLTIESRIAGTYK